MARPTRLHQAIGRLQQFEPKDGYRLAFSGGKDSVVLKHVADLSGVKYTPIYNNTTVDPPEVIKFIRRNYPEVIFEHPDMPLTVHMARIKRFPPLRHARWCCSVYKERSKSTKMVLTGVRRDEGPRRRSRNMVYQCLQGVPHVVLHPLIDWTTPFVWKYIRKNKLPVCQLYDEGFSRIGCIGCPMGGAKQRIMQFERWPGYEKMWRRGFHRMYPEREKAGLPPFPCTPDELFYRWINDLSLDTGETRKGKKERMDNVSA